jgi:glycopeptide antibiotics resistance protein
MLRWLLYPFFVYRSEIVPFLTLSAITVPCWLVARGIWLRRTTRRAAFRRELVLLTFVLYLSGLAVATLRPNHGSLARAEATSGVVITPDLAVLTCPSGAPEMRANERFFCGFNAKGNVLLFFPLGILLPLVWPRIRFWRGVLAAAALSAGIEVLQYVSRAWGSYRLADVNDVILNVLGAFLGLGFVSLLRLRVRPRAEVRRA